MEIITHPTITHETGSDENESFTVFESAAGRFSAPSWRVRKLLDNAVTERVKSFDLGPVTDTVLASLRKDGSLISVLAHAVVYADIMGAVDRAKAATL
tara:strand:- start:682 stop:975 length:294 start_codon:yes stop_codon:yes gene_type:complete